MEIGKIYSLPQYNSAGTIFAGSSLVNPAWRNFSPIPTIDAIISKTVPNRRDKKVHTIAPENTLVVEICEFSRRRATCANRAIPKRAVRPMCEYRVGDRTYI
jgi:hypothetical protein